MRDPNFEQCVQACYECAVACDQCAATSLEINATRMKRCISPVSYTHLTLPTKA